MRNANHENAVVAACCTRLFINLWNTTVFLSVFQIRPEIVRIFWGSGPEFST